MTIPILGRYEANWVTKNGVLIAKQKRHVPLPFCSKAFVIAARQGARHAKMFRVQFVNSEPGVMVQLSYFSPPHGILGRYTLDCLPGEAGELHFRSGGSFTGHPVKMTDHQSGIAAFSLTKHIKGQIQNATAPLTALSGHLFTVIFRGLEAFATVEPKDTKPPDRNRATLTVNLPEAFDGSVKVAGWWYPRSTVRIADRGPGISDAPNPVHLRFPSGRILDGFLIAPPADGRWGGYVLMLAFERGPERGQDDAPFLLFGGGFRDVHIPGRESELSFIAAMYQDRTDELPELVALLGTVDRDDHREADLQVEVTPDPASSSNELMLNLD